MKTKVKNLVEEVMELCNCGQMFQSHLATCPSYDSQFHRASIVDKPTLAEYRARITRTDCPDCHKPLSQEVQHYNHEFGYPVKGFDLLQWLHIECKGCADWAIWKIGDYSDPRFRRGEEAQKPKLLITVCDGWVSETADTVGRIHSDTRIISTVEQAGLEDDTLSHGMCKECAGVLAGDTDGS